MSAPTIGSLFSGVGGLDMAVAEVFDAEMGWHCEFDRAPSKALAHHFPSVLNLGDVTRVDFAGLPHTNIRCGGFPCQDVSVSGARAGMRDGTRSGLWSEFARSIAEDRPDWVVIENVGGLLSAEAHSDVEPCPWCLGDDPTEPALRALGAVLGDLAALGFDAEWTSIRAADVWAPHGRLRVFILAWPSANTDHAAHDGERSRSGYRVGVPRPDLTLLPTPAVVMNDGESAETWLSRREQVKARGINGNGMGMPLPIAVQLLPTPMVGSSSPAAHGQISGDFRARMDQALSSWGDYAPAIERWAGTIGRPAPSPVTHDGKGGKARLNPELTEWMMGWPAGWVTAPEIGLTRAEQLKACGNGVVPQQAAAALRELLARPGVPHVREKEAA
jgi:DNA (cytosine-5)-methyltransferase 1